MGLRAVSRSSFGSSLIPTCLAEVFVTVIEIDNWSGRSLSRLLTRWKSAGAEREAFEVMYVRVWRLGLVRNHVMFPETLESWNSCLNLHFSLHIAFADLHLFRLRALDQAQRSVN